MTTKTKPADRNLPVTGNLLAQQLRKAAQTAVATAGTKADQQFARNVDIAAQRAADRNERDQQRRQQEREERRRQHEQAEQARQGSPA